MADQAQMIFSIQKADRDCDVFDVIAEVAALFDANSKERHSEGFECDCQPEIFLMEAGARRMKHRRDC